jgi:hypothetical protein
VTLPDELVDPPFTPILNPGATTETEEHTCPPAIVEVQVEDPEDVHVVEAPDAPLPSPKQVPPPGCCRAAAGASAASQMVTVTSLAALNS